MERACSLRKRYLPNVSTCIHIYVCREGFYLGRREEHLEEGFWKLFLLPLVSGKLAGYISLYNARHSPPLGCKCYDSLIIIYFKSLKHNVMFFVCLLSRNENISVQWI